MLWPSFYGGRLTSDAGRCGWEATRHCASPARCCRAACFRDRRDPAYIEHTVETLVSRRVVGIALGYEDLNDHDELRRDPVRAVLAG